MEEAESTSQSPRSATSNRDQEEHVFDQEDLEPLELLSRNDLLQRLERQNRDLKDLRAIMTPFKVENIKLTKNLKHCNNQIREVQEALREFFSDPTRKQWFQERRDDDRLCHFFQKMVSWYREINDEDNPNLAFYQKIWMYERGESASSGSDAKTSDNKDEENIGMTSSNLYDACRTRTENMRLQEQLIQLREANIELSRANQEMQRCLREASAAPQQSGYMSSSSATPGVHCRGGSKPVQTLRMLAEGDSRWLRLVNDPDGLFSPEDVIDEAYQQYLEEILDIMLQRNCDFKDAITLLEQRPRDNANPSRMQEQPADTFGLQPKEETSGLSSCPSFIERPRDERRQEGGRMKFFGDYDA